MTYGILQMDYIGIYVRFVKKNIQEEKTKFIPHYYDSEYLQVFKEAVVKLKI